MSIAFTDVSIRGRIKSVPSLQVENSRVVVNGRWLKIARIFDDYWLEAAALPDPMAVLARCRTMTPRPDLFTFTQRVPHVEPKYDFARTWDNVAVIPLTTYDNWLRTQIASMTKRNIKAAANRGISVRVSDYDEAYVRGIKSIYDESPIRQGRRFWHYGKELAAVQAENGTYADRSTFLAAYYAGEMIGYLKMVWDSETAAIMQIMCKTQHYDKRPNNALMAEAVKLCCARNIPYLLYESFVYGKTENSLTEFKRANGFTRVDVPRYYVPLTTTGAIALRLGLHLNQKDRLPLWLTRAWTDLRSKWYRFSSRQG
jgi:hypothetical protein